MSEGDTIEQKPNTKPKSRKWVFDERTDWENLDLDSLFDSDTVQGEHQEVPSDKAGKGNYPIEFERKMKPQRETKAPETLPRARSQNPKLDKKLLLYRSPVEDSQQVMTKLGKEAKPAVFAAKYLDLGEPGDVLVLNSSDASLGLVLALLHPQHNFFLYDSNLANMKLTARNIEANAGVATNVYEADLSEFETKPPRSIVFYPESHGSLANFRAKVILSKRLLPLNGQLFLITYKKLGGPRHEGVVAQIFGQANQEETKKGMGGYMLVRATKKDVLLPDEETRRRLIQFTALGHTLELETEPSLFSREDLDEGTRMLLESTEGQMKQAGRILDLGCGWGAIGLLAATLNPEAEVTMIDVSPQAVEVARDNAAKLDFSEERVMVRLGDSPTALKAGEFDLVLSNPPFHAKTVELKKLFADTRSKMKKGGRIFIVVEQSYLVKFQGIMEEAFGSVRVHSGSTEQGYFILTSRK